jgi:hypothetical protein
MDGNTPVEGYGQLLPSPPPLTASDFDAWFFLFWAGLIVIVFALPWAISVFVKRRDPLPLLMLGAGLITSLGEPMLDLVGHLRWAENLHGPAFSNFGLDIPLLIPPCYALFMGLEAYWVYTVIQRGVTVKQFFLMFLAIGVSDAIMEHPGVIMGVYEYYGSQPFEFYKFPFYWSFTNGAAIATIGVILHFLWPHLKGRGWVQLVVLPIGIIGTTMAEFGTGFPVFLAINADIPTWLQWVIGSLTLVMAVLWIRTLAGFVCRDTEIEWTFWGLFRSRFMLPHQREAYIQGITKEGDEEPRRSRGAAWRSGDGRPGDAAELGPPPPAVPSAAPSGAALGR